MYKVKRTIYVGKESVDVWFGLVSKTKNGKNGKYTVYLLTDDPNKPLNHAEPILSNITSKTTAIRQGIEYAKSLGAKTACVCCNIDTEIGKIVDYPIEVSAGPEILTGSTRLKSGTCQKVIINMLSTAAMVGMGKVYKNLMVDVMATNIKLVERCRQIVMAATGCDWETADAALNQTDNHCKEAIVMILLGVDVKEAREKLEASKGWVRKAVE